MGRASAATIEEVYGELNATEFMLPRRVCDRPRQRPCRDADLARASSITADRQSARLTADAAMQDDGVATGVADGRENRESADASHEEFCGVHRGCLPAATSATRAYLAPAGQGKVPGSGKPPACGPRRTIGNERIAWTRRGRKGGVPAMVFCQSMSDVADNEVGSAVRAEACRSSGTPNGALANLTQARIGKSRRCMRTVGT